MTTKVYLNYSEFEARENKKENGVSFEFVEAHVDFEKQNEANEACWNCSRCSRCSDCFDCFELKNVKSVKVQFSSKSWFNVPVIEKIHQAVLTAVERPGALQMSDWHTCETTHCRAGWVVHLAGERGYALEKASSTIFAAMQIYKNSSSIRVSPTKFFGKNEVALADIKKCAEEEKNHNERSEAL